MLLSELQVLTVLVKRIQMKKYVVIFANLNDWLHFILFVYMEKKGGKEHEAVLMKERVRMVSFSSKSMPMLGIWYVYHFISHFLTMKNWTITEVVIILMQQGMITWSSTENVQITKYDRWLSLPFSTVFSVIFGLLFYNCFLEFPWTLFLFGNFNQNEHNITIRTT